jgi:RNA polymerase sigma-70 factor (ECF subfamily)
MADVIDVAQSAVGALGLVGSGPNNKRGEFDRLVQRYHKQAFNIAYRMTGNHADAEDLTQEAFVRAYRFFGNYRRDWPFDNWLYKIMSNLFVDDLRRKPKAKMQSLDQPIDGGRNEDVYLEISDTASNPERIVMTDELDEHIQRALNALPADFRMTVILPISRGCHTKRSASSCAARLELFDPGCIAAENCCVPRSPSSNASA